MASRRASRKRVSVAAVAGDCFSNRFQGPVNGAESRKYNRPEAPLPLRFQGCRTASRRCRAMPSPALIREADGDVPPPVLMPGRHEFRPRMHFLFRFHAASRFRPLRGGEASSAGNGAMRGMRQRATPGRGGARSDGGERRLVVVESPAKARTIGQFLGDGYRVMATRGHVRDLPAKAGSVKPEEGFAMVYETGKGRGADARRDGEGAPPGRCPGAGDGSRPRGRGGREGRVISIGREYAAEHSGEGHAGMFEERRCVIGRLAVAGRAAARRGGRAPQRSFVSGGLSVGPVRSATPGPRRDAGSSQNPCGWFPRRARPRRTSPDSPRCTASGWTPARSIGAEAIEAVTA